MFTFSRNTSGACLVSGSRDNSGPTFRNDKIEPQWEVPHINAIFLSKVISA